MRNLAAIAASLLLTLISATTGLAVGGRPGDSQSDTSIRVKVLGPEGSPLKGARILGRAHSDRMRMEMPSVPADSSGVALFQIPSMPTSMMGKGLSVDLVIISDKYPFSQLRIEKVAEGIEETVTLEAGKPLRVVFTGGEKQLPSKTHVAAFVPIIAGQVLRSFEDQDSPFTVAPAKNTGKNEWTLTLPESAPNVWIAIDEPGCLRGFVHGPITREDLEKGSIEVKLPETGAIDASFSLPDSVKHGKQIEIAVHHRVSLVGESSSVAFPLGKKTGKESRVELSLDHLAPGEYSTVGSQGNRMSLGNAPSDYYHDSTKLTLSAGDHKTVDLVYTPFSPDLFKGDKDVRLTVTNSKGEPAPRAKWALRVLYKQTGNQTVREGETDAKGIAEIKGLKGGADSPRYTVVIGDDSVGSFDLKGEEKLHRVALSMPLGMGDTAPEMTLTSMEDGKSLTLSSLRGQVVFLDFWATWCGPCQEPMAHNSEVLKKRGADWQGKATILAVSCDNTMEILRKHVTAKGWENVPQYWAGEGAFGSKPFRDYVITGVPTAFLLDKEGKIVWTGHPSGFDLEGEIDKLLAAK